MNKSGADLRGDLGLVTAGLLIGFSLGGFFDGILLHQLLQWHHLLGGLEGEGWRDLRVQIVADGAFHALMYVVGLVGLWLLWRRRRALAPRPGRLLLADVLIGFGTWHVLDAVLSHWLLGLHRIRQDAAVPLLWDLAWFTLFGVLFIGAGLALRRRTGGGSSGARSVVAAALLAAVTLAAGGTAALPRRGAAPAVAVVFRADTDAEQAFAALAGVGGRPVWRNADGDLWLVVLPETVAGFRLYGQGALFVGQTIAPAGCASWIRTRASPVQVPLVRRGKAFLT